MKLSIKINLCFGVLTSKMAIYKNIPKNSQEVTKEKDQKCQRNAKNCFALILWKNMQQNVRIKILYQN